MNQESVSITIPKHNSVADGRMFESSQLIAQHQMDVISFASLGKSLFQALKIFRFMYIIFTFIDFQNEFQ